MVHGEAEIVNFAAAHGHAGDGTVPAPDGTADEAASRRARLQAARHACESSLHKLDADLQSLDAERPRVREAVDAAPAARLRVLASMGAELRMTMHGLLGYVQLFRMRGGLDTVQAAWVDAMLAAGTQLLAQMQGVFTLADLDAEPEICLIEDPPPPGAPPAQPADPDWTEPGNRGAVARAWDTQISGSPIVNAPKAGAPTLGAPSDGGPAALHVLIADDVAMNRDITAAFVRAAGHTVASAGTGKEAVAAAAAADFDVILMDIRMPETDGFEATRLIRALPGHRGRVPIIALTAQASAEQITACRAAGMNGHLPKPYRHDTLNAAILAAAAPRQPETPPGGQGSPPNGSTASLPKDVHVLGSARDGRDKAGRMPADGADQPWIEIDSPWNATIGHTHGGHAQASGANHRDGPQPQAGGSFILDTQFKMKMTAIGHDGHRRLVGKTRSCAPPENRDQHEFHWLLYTEQAAPGPHVFSAVCDLWRWSGSSWRSIAVPGARFSPDEMHEQGWQYCGPCFERTAVVEVD